MSSMLTALLGQLTGDSVEPLARQVDADRDQTQRAIAAAVPMLLGALSRNAATPEGAASLHQAVSRDHDGGLLDNLSGFFGRPDTDDGDGILRHALGDRRGAVEQGIAKASGLDLAKVGPLLAMLAPVIMGMVGRQQRQRQLDTGGLADMLRQEQDEAERATPGLSGLGRLLDKDGDGQIADDLLSGLGGGLLGKMFGGR